MGKNPSVKDYAGNNYVRGSRFRTKLKKENVGSYRCRDCGTLRYVAPMEWRRAAKPHCIRCGGPLEETPESEKRSLGTKTERKRAQQSFELEKAQAKAQPQCRGCGARFHDRSFLAQHVALDTDCRLEYRVSRINRSTACLGGTAYVHRAPGAYKPWFVQALNAANGELLVVERFQRKMDAEEMVSIING